VALDLVVGNELAERLADSFWPGALTLVLPRGESSANWELGEETGTIAVRVPDHPLSLALLHRSGPIAATSANISGSPPLAERGGLEATFGELVAVYLVALPGAGAPSGEPSTVVEVSGDRFRVLRDGPIEAEEITRVAEEGSGMRPNRHSVH
jgi:tRNA threonylcarbamoyl adenosine modification protein (Sua5/YciO/YrdC/YwlC family)